MLDVLEINGVVVGYVPGAPLQPGVVYRVVNEQNVVGNGPANSEPTEDSRIGHEYYQKNSVPCFLSGTMLMTQDGLRPIDWIGIGDRVMTADHGF